jgi:hypothetical protein
MCLGTVIVSKFRQVLALALMPATSGASAAYMFTHILPDLDGRKVRVGEWIVFLLRFSCLTDKNTVK